CGLSAARKADDAESHDDRVYTAWADGAVDPGPLESCGAHAIGPAFPARCRRLDDALATVGAGPLFGGTGPGHQRYRTGALLARAPCRCGSAVPGAGRHPRTPYTRRTASAGHPEPRGASSLRRRGTQPEVFTGAPGRRAPSPRGMGSGSFGFRSRELL